MKLLQYIAVLTLLACTVQQVQALDNPKFIPDASNSDKGTLVIEQLYLGGIKSFEDVQVEFDFSTSTFRLLAITPADNSIPAQAVETFEAEGLSVGLRGCNSVNRSVTCHLLLTSNEFDREIRLCGSTGPFLPCLKSSAFDNLGNQYSPSKVTIANADGERWVDLTLIAGVTTAATIEFDNLSSLAVELSQLDLNIIFDSDDRRIKFLNVAF